MMESIGEIFPAWILWTGGVLLGALLVVVGLATVIMVWSKKKTSATTGDQDQKDESPNRAGTYRVLQPVLKSTQLMYAIGGSVFMYALLGFTAIAFPEHMDVLLRSRFTAVVVLGAGLTGLVYPFNRQASSVVVLITVIGALAQLHGPLVDLVDELPPWPQTEQKPEEKGTPTTATSPNTPTQGAHAHLKERRRNEGVFQVGVGEPRCITLRGRYRLNYSDIIFVWPQGREDLGVLVDASESISYRIPPHPEQIRGQNAAEALVQYTEARVMKSGSLNDVSRAYDTSPSCTLCFEAIGRPGKTATVTAWSDRAIAFE